MLVLVPPMEILDGELSACKRKMKFDNMEVEEVKHIGEILYKQKSDFSYKKRQYVNDRRH